MCLQDGYKLIRANQLLAALSALNTGQISFRSFRVYLASHELLAIREAAERSTGTSSRPARRRFREAEIAKLIGRGELAAVSRELGALRRVGLLSFAESNIALRDDIPCGIEEGLLGGRGERRLVPVPRKVLAFLAACPKPALAKTVVAYLLRGLTLERSGEIRAAGTVKISWICKLCKISERAARSARAELIRLGWISKDTGSFQRKLNRDGAYFLINKAWGRVAREIAPPRAERSRGFAPPLGRPETPSELKNQKLATREGSGFCEKVRGGKPRLSNILPDDIRKPGRLRELFEQATNAGWLERSEANLLNFAGAAVRANRAAGDSVRIFVGIVRKRLWHHISHEDEERGRAVLKQSAPDRKHSEQFSFRNLTDVRPRAAAKQMTDIATSSAHDTPEHLSDSLLAVLKNLSVKDEKIREPKKSCASFRARRVSP